MVEGARLESVFRGNSNVGSNPTLSAINHICNSLLLCLTVLRACGFGQHRVIFGDCEFEVEVHSAVFQG